MFVLHTPDGSHWDVAIPAGGAFSLSLFLFRFRATGCLVFGIDPLLWQIFLSVAPDERTSGALVGIIPLFASSLRISTFVVSCRDGTVLLPHLSLRFVLPFVFLDISHVLDY
jgi:hypothetical protein